MADRAIASAFVTIVPSLQGFSKDLNKQLSSTMDGTGNRAGGDLAKNTAKGFRSKMGGAFRPVLGALAASFSAVAVGGFLKDSVRAASDLNESLNAVNVTFGASAKEIQILGKQAATTIGLSESAFNGLAVQFSAFATTVAGRGGNVAQVIDELSRRGADFASVMNLDVNEAMRLFQSGLAGETEPLRRFGIDLSAAAVEMFALENGIWDGTGAMSESQKVMARYQALMAQTEKTAGDFANTSDELANRNRINAARFEDAKASLGQSLVPAMEMAASVISKYLIPALENVSAWMKDNPAQFKMLTIIMGALAAAIAVATVAQWSLNVAMLANPIGLVIAAVAAAIGLFVLLYKNSETVRTAISDLFQVFKDIWAEFGDEILVGLKAAFGFWVTYMSAIWSTIITTITVAIKIIFGILKAFFQLLSGDWKGAGETLKNAFMSAFKGLKSLVVGVFNSIKGAVKSPINAIIDWVNTLIGGLNKLSFDIPGPGGKFGVSIPKIPKLADGGFVDRPTMALIGEAGPEVVTPLRDFERMMGLDQKSNAARPIQVAGKTVAWLQELVDGRAEIVVAGAFSTADQYGRQFV